MTNIAAYIDHTNLKPEAAAKDIKILCEQALEYQFCSVCISPCYVSLAKDFLSGSSVKVCTVVGFPLGANTTAVKGLETMRAVAEGADEIDMVLNIGALKGRNYSFAEADIRAVVQAAAGNALVKVIIETCLLTDEEKKTACVLSQKAGADFVKTSTGFSSGGAREEDICLMRQAIGNTMKIKAAGGIRDYETAKKMILAGADRIGSSSGISIVLEQRKSGELEQKI